MYCLLQKNYINYLFFFILSSQTSLLNQSNIENVSDLTICFEKVIKYNIFTNMIQFVSTAVSVSISEQWFFCSSC